MLYRSMLLTAVVLVAATAAMQSQPAPNSAKITSAEEILSLAREGRHPDAWRAWQALDETPDHLRLGISLALATNQLERGIELYGKLETRTHKPDRQTLSDLAVRTGEDLSVTPDVQVRVSACAGALMLDKANAVCRRALDALAQSADGDERALAAYSMANAGLRPAELPTAMSSSMRLQLAGGMTRLSGAERVALLRPLLNDLDATTQYQAVLVATDIPGPDVAAALRNVVVQPGPYSRPLETAITLALARHGDKAKLATIKQSLDMYTGVNRTAAARVLVSENDPRGMEVLRKMLRSPQDTDQLQAAEALAEISPASATAALIETVRGASPAVRRSAILTAGLLGLGTAPEIYRHLTDSAPTIRAAAVHAIGTTFTIQDTRVRPVRAR
jgi:hypothetical protein